MLWRDSIQAEAPSWDYSNPTTRTSSFSPAAWLPQQTGSSNSRTYQALKTPPGSPLLRSFLVKLAKPGTAVPPAPNYDRATLDFIDENSHNLTPEELVKAGRALRLNFNS
jgi:hypothetical protein